MEKEKQPPHKSNSEEASPTKNLLEKLPCTGCNLKNDRCSSGLHDILCTSSPLRWHPNNWATMAARWNCDKENLFLDMFLVRILVLLDLHGNLVVDVAAATEAAVVVVVGDKVSAVYVHLVPAPFRGWRFS